MDESVMRAARWLVAGMVGCSVLLLGGFYWISHHHANRVILELRGKVADDLMLPNVSGTTPGTSVAPDLGIVRDEWNKIWTDDKNPIVRPKDTPIKMH